MTAEAVTYQRRMRRQGAWHKAFTRENYLRRFRCFIEKSDWDDLIISQEEWINRMCIGVIIVAAFYFVPPVVTILFLR
ncbi:MAG: hypothetical protein IH628_00525 [Proteobacteria bacterium]|nr:hypothetical protein [Pseudomonadota bacterium]